MERTPEADWSRLGLAYRSNAETRSFLEERVNRGGRRHRVGTSVEGRPIEAWEWQLGGEVADSPCLFLLSLVHPMEWISREIHLALLQDLLAGKTGVPAGTRIVSLLDANPDGTARVEAALRSGRPAWVRGNARGIDLNRNFPVGFRTRPRWVDFWPIWRPGPSPLSEPESRAILEALQLARATRANGPGESAAARGAEGPVPATGPTLTISLHSFGRWVFFPPAATRTVTPLAEEHRRVLARAMERAPAQGYRMRQLGRYAHWFRAFGTEIEALAGGQDGIEDRQRSCLAYLVELSWGGFGRWGLRRLVDPFFAFNPPHPERELARVRPFLICLIEEGLRAAARGDGASY